MTMLLLRLSFKVLASCQGNGESAEHPPAAPERIRVQKQYKVNFKKSEQTRTDIVDGKTDPLFYPGCLGHSNALVACLQWMER